MRRFYTATNRLDAYLVLHRLQRAGIPAHVFNEHVSSIVGEVPPDIAQPQIWLEDENDTPRAAAILKEIAADRLRSGQSVFCRSCSEENPANFELCWHCGAGL